jgi:iron-sulfur cluster assembly accessory protein
MNITQAAKLRLQELIQNKKDNEIGIKLGVKKRGCNGLSYTMEYIKEKNRMDEIVESDGITVVVDAKAVMFVIGTTMDFINTATRQEFVFTNPNAKGSCGCGESFNI